MTPEEIFDVTLNNAKSAFKKNNDQDLIEPNWGLSICATPIKKEAPLILGINWGGGSLKDNYKYPVQSQIPTKESFLAELKRGEYKFLSKSKDYIEKYLYLDIYTNDFNYSNLCFFRTPDLKHLEVDDIEISVPIFKEFVKELAPSWILSLRNTNIKYLKKFDSSSDTSFEEILNSKSNVKGYRGSLWSIKFYCLPHPQAHIQKINRDEIWENVFSGEL